MYAYLNGKFTYKSPALLHVDVNGAGYEVHISLNTYSAIQNKESAKLFVYLQIKEDGHTLYGFADNAEKEMFLFLISVSGVGASIARMMLSSLKPEEVATAIMQGNVRLLESVKGIGKKTAERLVLELKDKVARHMPATQVLTVLQKNDYQNDAFNALVSLGITRTQAEQAIQKITRQEPGIQNLEELIKKALKAI